MVDHIIPGGGIISSRWGRKSSGEDNGKRENGMEGKKEKRKGKGTEGLISSLEKGEDLVFFPDNLKHALSL